MQVHARSHIGKTLMLRRGHVVRLVAPTERIDDERQRRYGEPASSLQTSANCRIVARSV